MEQFFTKAITDKLPTFEHYKQLCYTLSVRRYHPYNKLDILSIDTMATIADIQTYMFNILSPINQLLCTINTLSTNRFYIAPNIYTSTLTLKEFFHCIQIDKKDNKFIYKYNIFYKGSRVNNDVYDSTILYNPPIPKQFISCYYIGVTEGTDDNNFKNLSVTDFNTLLIIMDKEYANGISTYKNEYIFKYWENKDIELFLIYLESFGKYTYPNYYIEKIIEKNKDDQDKLIKLYGQYSKKLNYSDYSRRSYYNNIYTLLKKYIKFPEVIQTIKLGFDTKAVKTITSTDTKVDITPSTVAIATPTIKRRVNETDGYRKIQLMINIANEELFKKLFEKDSTSKDTEIIINEETKVDFATGQKKTNEIDGYKKIQLMLNTANEKLFEKIQIELAKNNTIVETLQKKCFKLEEENTELTKKCDVYAMTCDDLTMMSKNYAIENAALVERTKILDESNF